MRVYFYKVYRTPQSSEEGVTHEQVYDTKPTCDPNYTDHVSLKNNN